MKRKSIKKAGIAVLSMAMLLSMGAMSAPVNAAGTSIGDKKITVKAEQGTFKLFRVAEATKNGNGAVSYTIMDGFKSVLDTSAGFVVSKEAITTARIAAGDKLDEMADHGAKIEAIAVKLEAAARAGVDPIQKKDAVAGEDVKFDVNEAGYYLIIGDSVAKTQPVLLSILPGDNIPDVIVKNSDIPFSKAITKITNAHSKDNIIGTDSENNAGGTGVSEEGGRVEYTLSTVFPKYDKDVTELEDDFTVTDIPEDSIVIDMNTITVYVDTQKITEGFTVTKSKKLADFKATADGLGLFSDKSFVETVNADGIGFQVVFDDTYVLENGGRKVDITFTATVTNADTGTNSNDNGATLSYSNNYFTGKGSVKYKEHKPEEPTPGNPNPPEEYPDDGTPEIDEEHPKVIPDDAFIFCTVATAKKTDPNGTELKGAIFQLLDSKGNVIDTLGSADEDSDQYMSRFTFKGLGEGTYTLHEVSAPAGYNVADDVVFTITANKKANTAEYRGSFTNNGVDTDGFIPVVDSPKQTLPGTGGIGDYMFMIGGAALVILACVLFVVYMKRRKAEE